MFRVSKKDRINKLIENSYWEGFQQGIGDGMDGGLEYIEHTLQFRVPLKQINEIDKIARKAGYDKGQELLSEAVARRQNGNQRIYGGFRYEIPGSVYAECYGAARI